MKEDKAIVATEGTVHDVNTGEITEARMYQAEGEEGITRCELDPKKYATWKESDGTIGIMPRTSSAFVGASKAYSAGYDSIDWGN